MRKKRDSKVHEAHCPSFMRIFHGTALQHMEDGDHPFMKNCPLPDWCELLSAERADQPH